MSSNTNYTVYLDDLMGWLKGWLTEVTTTTTTKQVPSTPETNNNNDWMKETTGYTILEWAQYMELVQAGVFEKLSLMVKSGELSESQYMAIGEYAQEYVGARQPNLLPKHP